MGLDFHIDHKGGSIMRKGWTPSVETSDSMYGSPAA